MKDEVFLKRLGKRIVELREEKSLSQVELANMMNKEKQSLGRVERGELGVGILYLKSLSEALGVPLSEILKF